MTSHSHVVYGVASGWNMLTRRRLAADKILSLLTELHRSILRRVPRVAAETALPWAIISRPLRGRPDQSQTEIKFEMQTFAAFAGFCFAAFALSLWCSREGRNFRKREPPRQPRRLPPLLRKEGSFSSAIRHSPFTIHIFSKTKRSFDRVVIIAKRGIH